jgi:hypothetical protein
VGGIIAILNQNKCQLVSVALSLTYAESSSK